MTVIADERRCVLLPTVQPGECFDVQFDGAGKFVLTRVEPKSVHPARVSVEIRGGFSVGVLDHPIDDHALAEALNEFP